MGSTRPNPTHVNWVGLGWVGLMWWVGLGWIFFDPPWWVGLKSPLNPTQPDPCTPLITNTSHRTDLPSYALRCSSKLQEIQSLENFVAYHKNDLEILTVIMVCSVSKWTIWSKDIAWSSCTVNMHCVYVESTTHDQFKLILIG